MPTLVTEGSRETAGENEEFDEIVGRIQARQVDCFADPAGQQRGDIAHHFGGRGVDWVDPDGQWLEIITVPHGV